MLFLAVVSQSLAQTGMDQRGSPGTTSTAGPKYPPTTQYNLNWIAGFRVLVNQELSRNDPGLESQTLELLRFQLYQITRMVPEKALASLRSITIWVERNEPHHPCMAYHPDPGWLKSHGMNPDKARCVEIAHARTFLDWTRDQPWMVLHELAHGYHHQFTSDGFRNQAIAAAYDRAMKDRLYERVLRIQGKREKAYATTNPMEFFAEVSEAFFGVNDFYPFVRAELREHDPQTYQMLEEVWGEAAGGRSLSQRRSAAGEIEHSIVDREQGRFAGWPANHGIWIWGQEILVGFSRGYDKDRGNFHHIDPDRPEEFLLARSKDGGRTWSIEKPRPAGALVGTPGARHGQMPPGETEPPLQTIEQPIDFTHPDFALTVRMENKDNGVSRLSYSQNRGHTWQGPYRLPLMNQRGVMGRTDYVIDGAGICTLFLTASKANGKEGRPFCARTTDGGLSWHFLSFIGPEPKGYAIMPSTVRLDRERLVTTIRVFDPPRSAINAYESRDDGLSWARIATPEPDAGEGNPPSLVQLPGGRLCLIYGERKAPFAILARLSSDAGKTWSDPIVLRDDAGGRDLGYVRSVVRPDGRVVAVYYIHTHDDSTRFLAATIWNPPRN